MKLYRSNLVAPDLQPNFPYAKQLDHHPAADHVVIGDTSLFAMCGYTTHDEAAILYNLASMARGLWIEIGAHTGWSTSHLAAPGNPVVAIEPEFVSSCFNSTGDPSKFMARFRENVSRVALVDNSEALPQAALAHHISIFADGKSPHVIPTGHMSWDCIPSMEKSLKGKLVGAFIDGNHDSPFPIVDAMLVAPLLAKDSIVVFHDAIGAPVFAGIKWLATWMYENGVPHLIHRYHTPQHLTVVATGKFMSLLPFHTPDPEFDWRSHMNQIEADIKVAIDKDYAKWKAYAEGWTRSRMA